MAQADLIREQGLQIVTLTAILDRARSDIVESQLTMRAAVEQIHQLENQARLLEDRVDDLRKEREERKRRYWAIVLAGIGSGLTLILNLVLTLWRG